MTIKLHLCAFLVALANCFASSGQDTLETAETCWRARALGNTYMSIGEYKAAANYFGIGEKLCDNNSGMHAIYERWIACLISIIEEESTDSAKTVYTDSILQVWNRMEANGFYTVDDDVNRGYYFLHASKPDYQKADFYLSRWLNNKETPFTPEFYPVYYANLCTIYVHETLSDHGITQRLIREGLELSSRSDVPIQLQDSIAELFISVGVPCKDFTQNVQQMLLEKSDAELQPQVNRILIIMEELECQQDPEFFHLMEELKALKAK